MSTTPFTPDPDGPPPADAGLFGLSPTRASSRVVVTPAPFEATVSYGAGTADAPEAVRRASHQIDLLDLDVGTPTDVGIHLADAPIGMADASAEAREAAVRVIDALCVQTAPSPEDLAFVNGASAHMVAQLKAATAAVLDDDKLPVALGGDHSIAEGPLHAVAERWPQLTVLQIDAHADLRVAYEGFVHSHASVMHNFLDAHPDVRLVQVGIRDLCQPELTRIQDDARITAFTGTGLRRARQRGDLDAFFQAVADACGPHVYVSVDIDGLEPTNCPNTGTPVPGGLTFDEAVGLFDAVAKKTTWVGLDLVEVGTVVDDDASDEDGWDAVVGARLLHKLIGFMLRSQARTD